MPVRYSVTPASRGYFMAALLASPTQDVGIDVLAARLAIGSVRDDVRIVAVLAFLVIGAVMMLFVRTNAAPSSG